MNPPVIVGDAATSVLLVVVQIGRQDHRLGLRWWLGASHATRVAGVSSGWLLRWRAYANPVAEFVEKLLPLLATAIA
jgi:hypothetical protein